MPAGKGPPTVRGQAVLPALGALNSHVGGRLRQRREHLGITQPELARLIRMPVTDLRDVEAGRRELPAPDLYKLATLMEVPVAWFYEGMTSRPDVTYSGFAESTDPMISEDRRGEMKTQLEQYFEDLSIEAQEKLLDVARVMARKDK